jgi:hypothetical protein
MKIDFTKFLSNPQVLEIDIKNFKPNLEKIREAGVDLIQTKYFLKKDSYAIMLSKDSKHMIFCNVNERLLLQAEESLYSETLTQVKETTQGMFNITCSGATLSKNKDIFAVGDFTGNVKLFSDQGKT